LKTLRLIPPTGKPIDITPGAPVTLGRDGGVCDVVLEDLSVSRVHGVISCEEQSWLVRDKHSSNGTFVDGQRVERARIAEGQELRFGAQSFRIAFVNEPVPDEHTVHLRWPGEPVGQPVIVPSARSVVAAAMAASGGVTQRHPSKSPGSTMRLEKAMTLLGVKPGMSRDEVRATYHRLRTEVEARLAAGLSPADRQEHERRLQELSVAVALLAPDR